MINKIDNKKIIVTIIAVLVIILLIVINLNKGGEEVVIENVETDTIVNQESEEINKIMIHIIGCINNPGVIEIQENARIIDVIEAAGGLTQEADISKVNLAYKVKDAQKIYIPSIYDEEEVEYINTENGSNVIVEYNEKEENAMVNINSATQTELETLPGIGPSTALKIISYREKNGRFKSIEDIKQVPGIGDVKFEGIKDMLEV